MQVDYLIVGQGISGTWLSYYLQKENRSFLIIDNNDKNAPSRLTAGIINPVTGRRHATVWMSDEILSFAWNAYNELGETLNIKAISPKTIIDFFPSPQMRVSFQERVDENAEYVSLHASAQDFYSLFNYEFGYGEIKPAYTAHLETIIPAWRQRLKNKEQLLEAEFDISQLQVVEKSIRYKDITAEKIFFCDGAACSNNPYFKMLPFASNKGEALILEIADFPADHIYKKGMILAPLATTRQWWVGSSYEWEFNNTLPSKEFRDRTEHLLEEWLKTPFTITEHLSGLRPATLERRPFVGLHPQYSSIGILNGMGTKGCSLAPFFARQLVDHLLHNKPITGEADIRRFSKILSR